MKTRIKTLHIFILTIAVRIADRDIVTFFVLNKYLVAFFFYFKKEL